MSSSGHPSTTPANAVPDNPRKKTRSGNTKRLPDRYRAFVEDPELGLDRISQETIILYDFEDLAVTEVVKRTGGRVKNSGPGFTKIYVAAREIVEKAIARREGAPAVAEAAAETEAPPVDQPTSPPQPSLPLSTLSIATPHATVSLRPRTMPNDAPQERRLDPRVEAAINQLDDPAKFREVLASAHKPPPLTLQKAKEHLGTSSEEPSELHRLHRAYMGTVEEPGTIKEAMQTHMNKHRAIEAELAKTQAELELHLRMKARLQKQQAEKKAAKEAAKAAAARRDNPAEEGPSTAPRPQQEQQQQAGPVDEESLVKAS
ncbi:MAG: hypothetical protein M1832_004631 [Thelocarpon impressellum]|nr:MAG: hypothetical protein M1832_004631 [Thelocarpon impressellum]